MGMPPLFFAPHRVEQALGSAGHLFDLQSTHGFMAKCFLPSGRDGQTPLKTPAM
jgi:hypothetical protein